MRYLELQALCPTCERFATGGLELQSWAKAVFAPRADPNAMIIPMRRPLDKNARPVSGKEQAMTALHMMDETQTWDRRTGIDRITSYLYGEIVSLRLLPAPRFPKPRSPLASACTANPSGTRSTG